MIKSIEKSDNIEAQKVLEKCKSLISVDTSKFVDCVKDNKAKQEMSELNCKSTINFIKNAVSNIAKEFVYIGFKLYECDYNKDFLAFGYDNISDFAFSELGFKKSTTYNFIRVYKRFAAKLPDNDGSPLYQVTLKYNDYSYSQLCEMLSLSDVDIIKSEIKPSDTIKDIRNKKKSLSEVSDAQEQTEIIIYTNKKINLEFTEDEALALLNLIEKAEVNNSDDYLSAKVLQDLRLKLYIKADVSNVV